MADHDWWSLAFGGFLVVLGVCICTLLVWATGGALGFWHADDHGRPATTTTTQLYGRPAWPCRQPHDPYGPCAVRPGTP